MVADATDRDVACERCFADPKLVDWVRAEGKPGRCAWCGFSNVQVVPLYELGPLFRDVARIYVPSDDWRGNSIGYLLQEDWGVFSDLIEADTDVRDRLATAILQAGLTKHDVDEPDYRGGFHHSPSVLEDDWDSRIESLFVEPKPKAQPVGPTNGHPFPDFDRLDVAIEDLSTSLPEGSELFRARLHEPRSRKTWFFPDEMGAPPPAKTPAQRANRRGEPVLYLASDVETALAEIRGWRGAAVAIATMRTARDLGVVDLTVRRTVDSPFFRDNLDWELNLSGALFRIAEDLSRPILRGEEETLYRASQHFCDLVRQAGLDGVMYPSALGSGRNLVVFKPSAVTAIKLRYVRITNVAFEALEMPDEETPYDDLPWSYPEVPAGE